MGGIPISVEALGGWDSERCRLVWARGSPWVRWSWWLAMGGVIMAYHGSIGFNGLARLDSMVARLALVVSLYGCWVGLGGGFVAQQN